MKLISLFNALLANKTETIVDAHGKVMTTVDKDGMMDVLPLLHYVKRRCQTKLAALTKNNVLRRKLFLDSVKKVMDYNGFTEREVYCGGYVAAWMPLDENTTLLDVIASILPLLFKGAIPSMLPIKEYYERLIERANEAKEEANDNDPEPENESNDNDPEPENESNDNDPEPENESNDKQVQNG